MRGTGLASSQSASKKGLTGMTICDICLYKGHNLKPEGGDIVKLLIENRYRTLYLITKERRAGDEVVERYVLRSDSEILQCSAQ
jgi:hypothetical protein